MDGAGAGRVAHYPGNACAELLKAQTDADRLLPRLPHPRNPFTLDGRRRCVGTLVPVIRRDAADRRLECPVARNAQDDDQRDGDRETARQPATLGGDACVGHAQLAAEGFLEQCDVIVESIVTDLDRLTATEIGQFGRQLVQRRHVCAADQDWNDGDPARERGGNLVTHEIVAGVRALANHLEPVRTDHRDHTVARRDRVLDRRREVLAGVNVLDVHEDAVAAKSGGQPIAQATGVSARVSAPVADEDAGHVDHQEPPGLSDANPATCSP